MLAQMAVLIDKFHHAVAWIVILSNKLLRFLLTQCNGFLFFLGIVRTKVYAAFVSIDEEGIIIRYIIENQVTQQIFQAVVCWCVYGINRQSKCCIFFREESDHRVKSVGGTGMECNWMTLINCGNPCKCIGFLQLFRMCRTSRDADIWFDQFCKALFTDDAFAVKFSSVCQHPNPAFQAVQIGIKSTAWIACLTYNLWNTVNFAVLLAVWHCSVLVFDGIDSSEIHIHSQRVTDFFLEQFLPGLTGQTLTQVAQCNIHLVLVAVFFAETKCRREISDTANQICSVLPNKGSHDIVTA